jgi:hypothetical protein
MGDRLEQRPSDRSAALVHHDAEQVEVAVLGVEVDGRAGGFQLRPVDARRRR